MQLTHSIALDFGRDTLPITIFAKQYDKESRFVEIVPLECGKDYTLESGVTARLQLTKPDGHTVLKTATIANGIIKVELTEQTLAVAGTAVAEIGLYKGNSLLSSQIFYIEIKRAAYNPDAPASSDEYPALIDALGKVETSVGSANSAAASANAAATKAETAAGGADTAAQNATPQKRTQIAQPPQRIPQRERLTLRRQQLTRQQRRQRARKTLISPLRKRQRERTLPLPTERENKRPYILIRLQRLIPGRILKTPSASDSERNSFPLVTSLPPSTRTQRKILYGLYGGTTTIQRQIISSRMKQRTFTACRAGHKKRYSTTRPRLSITRRRNSQRAPIISRLQIKPGIPPTTAKRFNLSLQRRSPWADSLYLL